MTEPGDLFLAAEARRELLEEILPFWRQHCVDEEGGGFVAEMTNDLRLRPEAAKGLILNSRILWTFAAAHPHTQNPVDRALATRAFDYLRQYFRDSEHGGFFWEVGPGGEMLDGKKKTYGQAFCLYAFTEYYRAFGVPEALEQAKEVFRWMERHCHDPAHGGYVETLARDGSACEDVRLSEKDLNEKKSMNNHLHVLEAYTNLLRVWPEPLLKQRLSALLAIFQNHILDSHHRHFHHFFDEMWQTRSDSYTYGHDIEGSWLLCEAAEVLGDSALQSTVGNHALSIARAVLEEGLDKDGGLFYEGRGGQVINSDKEWWPQAEAVVGFYNAYQLSGDRAFQEAAVQCWKFIQEKIVDPVHGEWFWKVTRDGKPDFNLPKVSTWKCPYHNGRCCLELLVRTLNCPEPQR
jgi:mannobiose 2-epimerase